MNVKGFSLLELVVVLLIIGLFAGIAFPALSSMYRSWEFALNRDDVLGQVGGFGAQAIVNGRPYTLAAGSVLRGGSPLELPDGWTLDVVDTVHVRSNGFCAGGRIRIRNGKASETYRLAPPYCDPVLIERDY